MTVDAVVFESGEFVGENRYEAFETWDAQLRAPRELASSLLQKRETQSVGEIVELGGKGRCGGASSNSLCLGNSPICPLLADGLSELRRG